MAQSPQPTSPDLESREARPDELLREAAALHFKRDLGIDVPPSQVIVSAGGKQAIFHALLATLDPGD